VILKIYQTNKLKLNKDKFILFYGKNEGIKKEEINKLIKNKNVYSYEENQVLNDTEVFLEDVFSRSFFDDQKIILINRVTDKLLEIIKIILEKEISDINFIMNAELLDKKSKLRNFFEKNKDLTIIPVYSDTNEILFKIVDIFFKNEKISISQENINFIISKINNDRMQLFNELDKIKLYCLKQKKITNIDIAKLINLNEDHSILKLIDYCLIKNKKKIVSILNENNFSSEDAIMIMRIYSNKVKKLLELTITYNEKKNLEMTIDNAKPKIFWKDKELVKEQIKKWKPKELKQLLYHLNETELLIKKNSINAINILTNFILEQSSI